MKPDTVKLLNLLINSVELAQGRGAYKLNEAAVIFDVLSKLKKEIERDELMLVDSKLKTIEEHKDDMEIDDDD